MGAPIASLRGVTKRFGATTALDAITAEFSPGVTGLIGANGAGKSTMFKLLLGLLEPSEGDIEILGLRPSANATSVRTKVGYAPERNVLPDDLAAGEFVRHMAEVRGLPRSEARGRASDMLWMVGLGEERERALGSMSTGQRQRVKLAQALAADPALVLLDEPTDGLDPMQREQMLELISSIHADFGIDIIVTSHVLDEIEQVCDSVVVLDGGKLAVAGRVDELAGSTAGVSVELVDLVDRPGTIAEVAATLRSQGLLVQERGLTLVLTSADEATPVADEDAELRRIADLARDAIAETGARVRSLGPKRLTLEDVLVGTIDDNSGGVFGGRS
ncbi:MAG: ABC-2 type transport system ATP-binding protein [Candidatus Poriferisodalaceae bacterium]|jgi:ABC-2 type transport system ATP-binding protein